MPTGITSLMASLSNRESSAAAGLGTRESGGAVDVSVRGENGSGGQGAGGSGWREQNDNARGRCVARMASLGEGST